MKTSLTPDQEAMVERILAVGPYADASEVIGEALRQLEERANRLVELRAASKIGEDHIVRGQVVEWTPALHADIMDEAKVALRAGARPKADVCPYAAGAVDGRGAGRPALGRALRTLALG